jgi:hypothetical protein
MYEKKYMHPSKIQDQLNANIDNNISIDEIIENYLQFL